MSNFKAFMGEMSGKALAITSAAGKLLVCNAMLTASSIPKDKKQEFAEEVSNLVKDKKLISELSDRIGEPSEVETEDEFVDRSASVLRRMLYAKFGIKD